MDRSELLSADEVWHILERWSERCSDHVTQRRGADRRPIQGPLMIRWETFEPRRQRMEWTTLEVFGRNLSSSGLGFLTPEILPPGTAIVVEFERVGGPPLRLQARVVRCRRVHNDFCECGAEFVGRTDAPTEPTRRRR